MKKKTKLAKIKRRPVNGCPPKFETVEALEDAIRKYFCSCYDNGDPSTGKIRAPLTITGLALALNMSRQCLNEYGKQDKFYDTVKKAKQIVEEFNEQRLHTSQSAGAIFNLTANFDWKNSFGNRVPTEINDTLNKIEELLKK